MRASLRPIGILRWVAPKRDALWLELLMAGFCAFFGLGWEWYEQRVYSRGFIEEYNAGRVASARMQMEQAL